jgi:hypothetical protein
MACDAIDYRTEQLVHSQSRRCAVDPAASAALPTPLPPLRRHYPLRAALPPPLPLPLPPMPMLLPTPLRCCCPCPCYRRRRCAATAAAKLKVVVVVIGTHTYLFSLCKPKNNGKKLV